MRKYKKQNHNKQQPTSPLKFNTIKKKVKSFLNQMETSSLSKIGRPNKLSDETVLSLFIFFGLLGVNNNIKQVYTFSKFCFSDLDMPAYKNFARHLNVITSKLFSEYKP